MGKEAIAGSVSMLKSFTDVVYVTDKGDMLLEVKRLLRQKRLSFAVLPIEACGLIRDQVDLIGTVVVDAQEPSAAQENGLARLIEWLENEHLGVILLTGRVALPLRSFSLSPSEKSFSLVSSVESISIDDLWTRISVNLAYRKQGRGMAVKPAAPMGKRTRLCGDKLAEQLQAVGDFIESLTEQLRVAGLVQRDFLPSQLPNSSEVQWARVFLPAEWVSGDIYDVARIDEQHVGFYIADAVGHAMPAALLTIFLKQALVMRETVGNSYRIFPPAEVMRNLNVRMGNQKLSGYQFATCCYCVLNIKTLQLTYARAGHPYPVLIRSGRAPEQLEVRGSLLGVFDHAEYVQQSIQLEHGDKVLLYSDGAESFVGHFDDQAGFCFNEEFHAMKDFSIGEITDRLTELAKNHECEQVDVDDITVVGLEVL